jgi:hypothetical protein
VSFSGIIRYRLSRRITGIVLALAGLIVLPGCWVTSINSLYEDGFLQSKDPDVVSDQRLTGTWTVIDDKCTTVLTISAMGDAYDLQSKQQGRGCVNRGEKFREQARLVKLGAHYFLDSSPLDKDVCQECLAKHTIYEVKIDENLLSLIPIDSDWLKNAVESKTVTLATVPNDTDKVTALSADLKAFCRKYADDPEAFKSIPGLVFKRK